MKAPLPLPEEISQDVISFEQLKRCYELVLAERDRYHEALFRIGQIAGYEIHECPEANIYVVASKALGFYEGDKNEKS